MNNQAKALMAEKIFESIAACDIDSFQAYTKKSNNGSIKHLLSTIRDSRGYSPLHAAVLEGSVQICARILKLKVNVNLAIRDESHKGVTALHLASQHGRLAMVKLLMQRGASYRAKRIPDEWTPLHCASHAGYKEVVQLLISKGADVNASSEHGTPLVRAVAERKHAVIEFLLESRANPNVFSGACTPLLSSVIRNDALSVELLLEAGADPDYGGPHGMPLLVARESRPDIVPLLINHGADTKVIHWTELERESSLEKKASLEGKLTAIADKASIEGNFGKALYYYSEAMSHADAPNDVLLSERVRCWCRLGNGDQALQDAKTLILKNPNWAKAYRRAGDAYMVLRDYRKAEKAFDDSLRLDLDFEERRSQLWQRYHEASFSHQNHNRCMFLKRRR